MTTAVSVGILCAIASILLFVSGAAVGWKLRGVVGASKAPPSLTEEQERRVEAARREEEAFRQVQQYDRNVAYGGAYAEENGA